MDGAIERARPVTIIVTGWAQLAASFAGPATARRVSAALPSPPHPPLPLDRIDREDRAAKSKTSARGEPRKSQAN